MALIDDMLAKLPDAYNKDINGYIGNLFNIVAPSMELLVQVFNTIQSWRDIDNAQGSTLDRIGVNLLQPRGSFIDDHYRVLLKSKIQQSLSKGDINTIIQVAATMLNVSVNTIQIVPVYPASIYMTFPYGLLSQDILNNLNLILGFIQNTLAAGVLLLPEIAGTFTFGAAANYPEIDSNAGFSDINQQTGGYLGGQVVTS